MIQYEAFVSYRAVEPDRTLARELHKWLERQRTPRQLIRAGVPEKLGRIFLDENEMEGGRISTKIRDAVSQSRFLILLCSRQTPGSVWIADEVEAFLSSSSAKQVLVVGLERNWVDCIPKPLSAQIVGDGGFDERNVFSVAPSTIGVAAWPSTVQIEILSRLLDCEAVLLAASMRRKRRVEQRLVGAGSALLLSIVGGVSVWLNAETAWRRLDSERQVRTPGLSATRVRLSGTRVAVGGTFSGFQILDGASTPPATLISFPSRAEAPWDRMAAIQPGHRFALATVRGDSTLRALDFQTGAVTVTPLKTDGNGVFNGGLVERSDAAWFLPEPADVRRMALYFFRPWGEIVYLKDFHRGQPPTTGNLSADPSFFIRTFGNVTGYFLSGDRRRLVGSAFDGLQFQPAIWELPGGRRIATLTSHSGLGANDFALNPEGDTVATVFVREQAIDQPTTIDTWRVDTGALRASVVSPSAGSLAYSPGGELLLVGGPSLVVLGTRDLRVQMQVAGPLWVVTRHGAAQSFEPLRRDPSQKSLLVFPDSHGLASLWEPREGASPDPVDGAPLEEGALLHSDGAMRRLLVVGKATAHMIDLETRVTLWHSTGVDPTARIQFSLDGRLFAVLDAHGTLQLIESDTGRLVETVLDANEPLWISDDRACKRILMQVDPGRIELTQGTTFFRRWFRPSIPCDRPARFPSVS